ESWNGGLVRRPCARDRRAGQDDVVVVEDGRLASGDASGRMAQSDAEGVAVRTCCCGQRLAVRAQLDQAVDRAFWGQAAAPDGALGVDRADVQGLGQAHGDSVGDGLDVQDI